MNKKVTILATLLLFFLGNVVAQDMLSSKKRELKPQTNKSFTYTTINSSDRANTTDFKYKTIGFLKKPLGDLQKLENITIDPVTHLPIEIYLLNPVKKPILQTTEEKGLIQQVLDNISMYSALMQIENLQEEFTLVEKLDDPLGHDHYRLQQNYKGVKVYGGQLVVHENKGVFDYINGTYFPTPIGLNTVPGFAYANAEKVAIEDVKNHTHYKELSKQEQSILDYTKPIKELVIYHLNGDLYNPKLVWHLTLRPNFMDRYEYYIDAQTGSILNHYDNTCAIKGSGTDLNNKTRDVECHQSGSSFYLINTTKSMFPGGTVTTNNPKGVIWTIDASNTDGSNLSQVSSGNANSWSDRSSVSAHYNAGIAFDYYKTVHNRNSINGKGGTITSIVNVTKDDVAMDNAYWNGSAMFYGNGASTFYPLAGALDVAGHEMTHGVVQNTAGLEYNGQSGAINESMADIFGAMMDRDDWKVGEDIIKSSAYTNGALRDLSNPHQGKSQMGQAGYQPMNMDEYYTGSLDNYGVHINSGIVNHAFYKFATAIGKEKAEQVYYRTLSLYLTQSSKFLNLRQAVVKSCGDLYGTTEINAAKSAFDFVKIYDPNENGGGTGGGNTGDGDDLPAHTGTPKIILNGVGTSSKIYRGNNTGTGLEALSNRAPKSRMTVRDDGGIAYFVAADKTLRGIDLTDKTEFEAQGEKIWSNVAVSPDGKRLAAITEEDDTAIWMYDFAGKEWYKFTLYNPSNEGIKTYNVDFADALEWNYSGEYIMYDAQNTIGGNSYFDIGIMKVWKNETNKVGNGTIEKMFTSIPDGVSVGNATFSKISPYIIAMDYVDNNAGRAYILGLNLNTKESNTIFTNNIINYPNYSMDDKSLTFNYNNSGTKILANVALASNKIAASTTATVLVSNAEKGVYYAVGTRNLLSTKKDIISFDFLNMDPVVKGVVGSSTINLAVPFGTDITKLRPTFTHSVKSKVLVGSIEQISGVSNQNFTNKIDYTIKAEDNSTKKYTVQVTVMATSINEIMLSQTKLYPVPTKNTLNLEYPGVFTYHIKSILGKNILDGSSVDKAIIPTENLGNGIYFLTLKTTLGEVSLRFIKN